MLHGDPPCRTRIEHLATRASPKHTSRHILPPTHHFRAVNRGYTLDVVLWVIGGLSTLLVILRAYTRFVVIKAPVWDDAIVVVSALTNLVGRALVSVSIAYGVGRRAVYLSPEDLHQAAYYTLINPVFGVVAAWLPKLAVAMLIISLSGPLRRGVWVLYPVLVVSTVPALLGTIFNFTQCFEPGSKMHFFSPPACVAPRVWSVTAIVASGALHLRRASFSDLVLAFYPITLLWNLRMKRTRKITVIIVMAFGLFAFTATIVKATELEGEHAQDLTYGIF
ncbi:hypothetical protein F5X98DRAFT_383581 [Xylaria grammica]|nr:hypothetical protein F5X98DRAFT_383581 [Xylaria grammica]